MAAMAEPLRASFHDVLESVRAAVERSRGLLALLVVDIGDLPALETRFGLEAGETLVARLAQRLAFAMRECDEVLRIGDGRFCVLVGALQNRGHAVLAAEKIWRLTDETIADAVTADRPDVRIGIAIHPAHADEPRELLRRAQLAAAGARERGERLLIYDEGCDVQVLRRWELKELFAAALEAGEIEMHYQPKIRIAEARPAGAEALMRWIRDGRAVATPDEFIPLAEEAGVIQSATWYALNVALRQASEWPAATLALDVAVNITPGVLHHREFNHMVESALRAWNFPSERLTLEITEGALIVDPEEAMAKLHCLRDLGVRIAIDDFGTGYSSLSYFKKIPADELKIDKSFVTRMLTDEADERIVRTIVGLARPFHLSVVAEGVEDGATLAALAEMGCDYAQGFHFAPALPQRDFLEWLDGAMETIPPTDQCA